MYDKLIRNIWGKEAVHLPNITDVFGYEAGRQIEHYASRIILALPEGHSIVLPKCCQTSVDAKLEYYKEIGLPVINSESIHFVDLNENESLVENSKKYIENVDKIVPYTHSDAFNKVVEKRKESKKAVYETVRNLNNKCYFRRLLESNGINTPLSFYFNPNGQDILGEAISALQIIENNGYDYFALILAESYSGFGVFQFHSEAELIKLIHEVGDKEFLISPWYKDVIGQPSFQMYIGETLKDDVLFGITDQIIDGAHHTGNVYPSKFENCSEIQEVISKSIRLLHTQGFHGFIGIDMIVRNLDGQEEIYVLEANARQTAAFYPELISMKLFGSKRRAWSTITMKIDKNFSLKKLINKIRDGGIAYHYGDEGGVLIIDVVSGRNECILMIIGNSSEDVKLKEDKLNEVIRDHMKSKNVGLWMYRNEGGDMAQSILKKELEVQGIEVINNFDLRDAYCKNGVVYTKDGFNLSSLDVLYHMNFDEKTPHVDDILKAIEYSGVEVINNMQSYFLASDKFLTNVVLKKAGIPVPDMILVSSDTCYDELKKLLTDWKSIVVKTRFGGGGKGIIKVNTVEELNDLMPLLKKCSHNVYLEKYVPFGDHDHRVEIFNGEIVGCYNRTKSHSFKTNTHAGGSIVYLGDNFEVIEIAKKAAIALDVMTTTVDILKDEITGDYVVVEVNELMGMCVYHYYKHLGIEVSDAFHHDEKKIKLLAQYINKRCRC